MKKIWVTEQRNCTAALDRQWRIQVWADRPSLTKTWDWMVAAARSSLPQTRGEISFKSLNFWPHFVQKWKMYKKFSASVELHSPDIPPRALTHQTLVIGSRSARSPWFPFPLPLNWQILEPALQIARLHEIQERLHNAMWSEDYVAVHIQGGQKKVSQRNLHITSSNTSRFSKFLHCNILREICNRTVIKTSVFCELWQSCWKKWTLQNPDAWQAAFWALNDMLIVLPSTLTGNVNKKAVLSQRWPRNAPYIRLPWKLAGLPDYSKRMSIVATNVKNGSGY